MNIFSILTYIGVTYIFFLQYRGCTKLTIEQKDRVLKATIILCWIGVSLAFLPTVLPTAFADIIDCVKKIYQ